LCEAGSIARERRRIKFFSDCWTLHASREWGARATPPQAGSFGTFSAASIA